MSMFGSILKKVEQATVHLVVLSTVQYIRVYTVKHSTHCSAVHTIQYRAHCTVHSRLYQFQGYVSNPAERPLLQQVITYWFHRTLHMAPTTFSLLCTLHSAHTAYTSHTINNAHYTLQTAYCTKTSFAAHCGCILTLPSTLSSAGIQQLPACSWAVPGAAQLPENVHPLLPLLRPPGVYWILHGWNN